MKQQAEAKSRIEDREGSASRTKPGVTPKGARLFRLMAQQPVSVTLEEPKVVNLRVSDNDCRFFLVPVHDDPSAQRTVGGSWIHVEFTDDDPDILRATALGLRIVDDLLSGLSLVTGVDFRDSLPAQIVDVTTASDARFMVFLNSDYKHRSTAITAADVGRVQGIIAHWDGLPRGNRLRRAGFSDRP